MLAFDFSTLPKIPTHAQLGSFGDIWDAFTISQANQELVCEHNLLINQANDLNQVYQDALNSGETPDSVLYALSQSINDYVGLVQDHTGIMNAYYQATGVQPSGDCPMNLSGLRSNGLGQWQIALPAIWAFIQNFGRQVVWVYIIKILGDVATSFKSNADAKQTDAKATLECYYAFRDAVSKGLPPPDCTGLKPSGGISTTTILLGGIGLLAIMMLAKR